MKKFFAEVWNFFRLLWSEKAAAVAMETRAVAMAAFPVSTATKMMLAAPASKKVSFLARSGQRLTARVVLANGAETVVLRRAGHPKALTFSRPASEVFIR